MKLIEFQNSNILCQKLYGGTTHNAYSTEKISEEYVLVFLSNGEIFKIKFEI